MADTVVHTEIQKGLVQKIGLPVIVAILGLWFVWSNWDTISTASRKLDTVDTNLATSSQNKADIAAIKLLLIGLEDFQGDMTGRVVRMEGSIGGNTNWRTDQEKRATQRIKDHEARDKRLDSHDYYNAVHEETINALRDFLIRKYPNSADFPSIEPPK